MSDAQQRIESILAADIGSTLTHVCLIDRVEGVYRLVACAESPSTIAPPESDLNLGLRRAIQQIEQITQRALLNEEDGIISPEQESGAGVDAFVATSNAAPPLECVIVGLTDDLSIESAQRACASANVVVTQAISLARRMRRWDEAALVALHQSPPDLLILVGGMDTGPVAPLEGAARVLAALFTDIEPDRRPVIAFAGNQEARRPLSAILSPLFDFHVVDNVRPNIHTESLGELQRELAEVYERVKLPTLPGYRRLRRWCTAPILSTMQALGITLRFLARNDHLADGVLGVDIGGATTFIGSALGEVYQWAIGANLGTSYGVSRVVERATLPNIRRWMPISMSADEVVQSLENTRLRPNSIPQTMEDLLLIHAVARQALLFTVRNMAQQYWHEAETRPEQAVTPAFSLIAARGGALAHTPQDGVIALTLLDALQPTGLTRLVIDWASIWPQLGALAGLAPVAAAQVLEHDGLWELGAVLSPIGEARDEARALHLKLTRTDGQTFEADLPAGTIWRFPLAPHERATLEVRPSRDFDIGLGRKGAGGRAEVRGGSLGLLIDTRGRPLSLPQDPQQRQEKLQQWLGNLINHGSQPS